MKHFRSIILLLLTVPLSPGVLATELIMNTTETGKFGYQFDGVVAQRESAEFTFHGEGSDLEISLSGYDVDADDEVEVLVNDTPLDYLKKLKIILLAHLIYYYQQPYWSQA